MIGLTQPFLLPYQALDDLALQSMYGDLLHVMAGAEQLPENRPESSDRVRVGIVSAFFYDHSNWKVPIQGWLKGLANQFDLFAYHTGEREDRCTLEARSVVKRFCSQLSVEEFVKKIRDDHIDVLIYPEIGMHPVTTLLATKRLASIQCVSWGHPVTSGLQSMDYFISSELMEPEGAEQYYREKLIRLPGLSFRWSVPQYDASNPVARSEFGLEDDDVVYLCVQNLSKYLPGYDGLLIEIVKRVPAARLVFIESEAAETEVLRHRLEALFVKAGINYQKHVVFLSRLDSEAYHRLNRVADVFLDTPEWSGCNSTLEALWCDVPVVTLPGRWMRGRHSMAIYQQMGYEALIARDTDQFVDLAVRLGLDQGWRESQRKIIARGKGRLIEDDAPVKTLADILGKLAHGSQIGSFDGT